VTPVTVQEAEIVFTAAGMTKAQSLTHAAGKRLDKVASSAGLAGRALGKARRQGAGSLSSVAEAAGSARKNLDAMAASALFKVLTGSQEYPCDTRMKKPLQCPAAGPGNRGKGLRHQLHRQPLVVTEKTWAEWRPMRPPEMVASSELISTYRKDTL